MNGQCPKCFKYLKLTKHHVLPVRFFGNPTNSPKLLICRGCHSELEKDIPEKELQPVDFYREVITKFLGYANWKTALLLAVIFVSFNAYGQNKIVSPPYYSHEAHKDYEDMEEDIRFKSVFVIAIEPRTIFWKKESKEIVYTGSFTTDDRSRVSNVQKGCYIAIYCLTHNYLYALYPCR